MICPNRQKKRRINRFDELKGILFWMNCLKAPWIKLKDSFNNEMQVTPVKTPVKSPKAGSVQGSVPKFSAVKYYFDIDVIKCPVCSLVFSSPRILPCGHSACIGCLNNLILYTDSSKTRDFFLCPVCQKTTKPSNNTLKYKWAAQFPVNSTLVRILRNALTGSISEKTFRKAFCDICLKNNWTKATYAYCNSCLEYQCDACAGYHGISEDTKNHEMTWFIPRPDRKPEHPELQEIVKVQIVKPTKAEKEVVPGEQRPEGLINKDRKDNIDLPVREKKLAFVAPIPPVVVAQTVTAASGVIGKSVIKLGYFDGKAPGDDGVSEFHGIAFLTDGKVAMTDFNNKKVKLFDISHKTRVELVSDIVLRAHPRAICRVDSNTLAVLTERVGLYHIRLFTLRDRLQHFVQKTIEGSPVGIAYISKTIICTLRQDNCLHKYRLTRSQQLKTGTVRRDPAGNELFRNPGVMTSGTINGCPVLYAADENEYGVTVVTTDIIGRRKSTVFFECDDTRPKKKVRTADVVVATKSGRLRSRKSALRLDDTLETVISDISEADKNSKSSGQTSDKKSGQSSGGTGTPSSARKEKGNPVVDNEPMETLNLRLNQTFPKIQSKRQVFPSPKGRRTERYLRPENELLGEDDGLLSSREKENDFSKSGQKESGLPKSAEKRTRTAERKRSGKAVGKLETIDSGEIFDRPKTVPHMRKADDKRQHQDKDEGRVEHEADEVLDRPKTDTPIRPKVYRADGLAVDNEGNIYVCMCSSNRVHQTTPDGRLKCDILSEKDGLMGPKAIAFSPSNDIFLVACANNNKVGIFRIK